MYFYRDVGPRRYVTDAHLYDPSVFSEITQFLNQMEFDIGQQAEPLPERFEIVLELRSDWDGWGYYMVDHGSRCVFWMAELDILWAIGEEFVGLKSLAHFSKLIAICIWLWIIKSDRRNLEHWIDVSYWRHWELFPADKIVPPDVIRELTAVLLHGSVGESSKVLK